MDIDYRGIYANQEVHTEENKFYEGGAHFKYSELYQVLYILHKENKLKEQKEEEEALEEVQAQLQYNYLLNSRNFIPQNRKYSFHKTLSRNNKPLIESYSEKISECINSPRDNKKSMQNTIYSRKITSQINTIYNNNYSQEKINKQKIIKQHNTKDNNPSNIIDLNFNLNSPNLKYQITHSRNKPDNSKSQCISNGGNIIQNIIVKPNINIAFVNNINNPTIEKKSRNITNGLNMRNIDIYYSNNENNKRNNSFNIANGYNVQTPKNSTYTGEIWNSKDKNNQMKKDSKTKEIDGKNNLIESRNKEAKPVIYDNNSYNNNTVYLRDAKKKNEEPQCNYNCDCNYNYHLKKANSNISDSERKPYNKKKIATGNPIKYNGHKIYAINPSFRNISIKLNHNQ